MDRPTRALIVFTFHFGRIAFWVWHAHRHETRPLDVVELLLLLHDATEAALEVLR